MRRSIIIKSIMNTFVRDNDIVVASTGYISRQVYHERDRDLNFYIMGSMGSALGIGLGMALNTKRRVIVINGDGSVLMSLGTMLTAQRLNPKNLYHFVLDNNCHESTGGQRTVSDLINLKRLHRNTIVYKISTENIVPPRIPLTPKQITERFMNAVLCK